MKILVADDHEVFRAGIMRVLTDLVDEVTFFEVGDFDAAIEAIRANQDLDLVLLDLKMPGMDAHASVRAVKAAAPEAMLVVISASESRDDVLQAIKCGAAGYIPKTASAPIMVSALRLVLAGGIYLPSAALIADPGTGPAAEATADAAPALTPREHDVLEPLVRGLSNKEIARCLGLSASTVKIHVASILRKLNAANRTEAVITAERMGIVQPSTPSEPGPAKR